MKAAILARSHIPETEKPRRVSNLLKPSILVWILVIVAIVMAVVTAINTDEGILWLFEIKTAAAGDLGDIAIVLAPLLALALAIERLIETFFDLFEQATTDVAKLGTAGAEGLQWLQNELDRAWEAAEEVANKLGQEGTDESAALKKLGMAEERIIKANNRITGLTKDPKYISSKRMLSIWIGLLMGLIVAILSDSGIFELLQISVPRILDMLVTGFVIGAGSGPMHSLVGILQGAKDTLEGLGELASLAPLKEQIKELKDKIED